MKVSSTVLNQPSFLCELPKPKELMEVRVIKNSPIAKNQWSLWVKPEQGQLPEFEPGQFCMLSLIDRLDPLIGRPFAIVDHDDGMYQFIYRVHGKLTAQLVRVPIGSKIGLLGPLGRGISRNHLKSGKHIFIAGGVGYASVLPLIQEISKLKRESSARIYYGVREDLEVIRKIPLQCDIASDDGSSGFHGRLPDLLKKNQKDWSDADWFYVCGPTGMMKALYDLLPPEKSLYFLEETMGCGFGICIGCVVPVSDSQGQTKKVRSCLEGPIFKGDLIKPWKEGEWAK